MFDGLVPIGDTCNITFLLQNAKLKRETSLFEWFVSPHIRDITNVLREIHSKTDHNMISKKRNHVYIGPHIYSGHYGLDEFKEIYKRRRDRLCNTLSSSKRLLFCRMEGKGISYGNKDIDDFINAVKLFNSELDVTLLLITNDTHTVHPTVTRVFYSYDGSDPYCRSKEINELFVNSLKTMGYDTTDTVHIEFNDKS